MKIVINWSLGCITKCLAKELVQKGNQLKVISSKKQKRKDMESLGARASIGYR